MRNAESSGPTPDPPPQNRNLNETPRRGVGTGAFEKPSAHQAQWLPVATRWLRKTEPKKQVRGKEKASEGEHITGSSLKSSFKSFIV